MVIKIHEIRNQSTEELRERISRLKKELYELRLTASVGKVEKPHQFEMKKREIAKVLTILQEREIQNDSSKGTS